MNKSLLLFSLAWVLVFSSAALVSQNRVPGPAFIHSKTADEYSKKLNEIKVGNNNFKKEGDDISNILKNLVAAINATNK